MARKTKKPEIAGLKLASDPVSLWRARIARFREKLAIDEREKAVGSVNAYLVTEHRGRTKHEAWYPHLLPMVEQAHRNILGSIPPPTVEARVDENGRLVEARAAALLSDLTGADAFSRRARRCRSRVAIKETLWDDFSAGFGVVRVAWVTEYGQPLVPGDLDADLGATQVELAQGENLAITQAFVADTDIDWLHLKVHDEWMLAAMNPAMMVDPAQTQAMQEHMDLHRIRMETIADEGPVTLRVPWRHYAWDCDVPWDLRTWEAELRPELVAELAIEGFTGLTEENLVLEDGGKAGELPLEDRRAWVWYCRDRKTNRMLVMSDADGTKALYDGPDLMKGDCYQLVVTRPWTPDCPVGWATGVQALKILDDLAEVEGAIRRHVREHSNYKIAGPKTSIAKAQYNNPDVKLIDLTPEESAAWREFNPPALPVADLQYRDLLLEGLRHLLSADPQTTGAPNPHQISATETAVRASEGEERRLEPVTILSNALGYLAFLYLDFYRRFATQGVTVQISDEFGERLDRFNPADLPACMDIVIDVGADTPGERAKKIANAIQWRQLAAGTMIPIDDKQFLRDVGRWMGFHSPDRYYLPMAPNPGAIEGDMNVTPQSTQAAQPPNPVVLPFQYSQQRGQQEKIA